MHARHGVVVAVVAMALWPAASTADGPVAHSAAKCSDYPNQKASQEAADTHDADGVGIYCEDLPCPCPCSTEAGGGGQDKSCAKPTGVQRLVFAKDKYPNIRKHFRIAVRKGWPGRLVVNRPGADARRDRLLEDIPTKVGFDRDEYPPAVGRGKGPGLEHQGADDDRTLALEQGKPAVLAGFTRSG